ncbi:MAG: folate-binding protein [Pseudomonadota bacterium]
MSDARGLVLENRAVLEIAGDDRESFLQGIVSNDVTRVSGDQAIWSAFLTPQGKFLHEFCLVEHAGLYLLDCEASRLADLKKRLSIYRLRSKVTVADASERYGVAALFGADTLDKLSLDEKSGAAAPVAGGVVFVDPRLAALGARAILPRGEAAEVLAQQGFAAASQEDYDRLRISLGVPDGSRDLEVDKALLLESGFDELGGVDWDKGCFLGQELTARTKYRALIKKRLLPVEISGPLPEPGTAVMAGAKEVGQLRSRVDGRGLALLRLEALDSELTADGAKLTPVKPDWLKL